MLQFLPHVQVLHLTIPISSYDKHFHYERLLHITVIEWHNARQAMCVWRNNEARSCNHCCSGKAIPITQPVCEFVALGIQHSMRMRRIATCGLPRSTIFFHIFSLMAQFCAQKILNTKRVFWFSLQFMTETFLTPGRIERDMIFKKCMLVFMWCTHYSFPILMTLEFSRQIFEKSANIKFH
jgi:hypothetical protein